MKLIVFSFILSIFMFSGCSYQNKSNKNKVPNKTTQTTTSKIIKTDLTTNLTPYAQKKIKNWEAYHLFKELLNRYKNTSESEALSNSKELANIALKLKDSIPIESLKTPNVKTRFAVLYNETLRLNVLADRIHLQPNEVKNNIQDIFDAFSASNAKINNIYSQKRLEQHINDLNIKVDSKN